MCNQWYYLNGQKYCPLLNTSACTMAGTHNCGLFTIDNSIALMAWECPRCHKINAWFVRQCDCPPLTINTIATNI